MQLVPHYLGLRKVALNSGYSDIFGLKRTSSDCYGLGWVAETKGFEPLIHLSAYNALAKRRLQPLGHISVPAKHPYRCALGAMQDHLFGAERGTAAALSLRKTSLL